MKKLDWDYMRLVDGCLYSMYHKKDIDNRLLRLKEELRKEFKFYDKRTIYDMNFTDWCSITDYYIDKLFKLKVLK